MRLHTLTVTAFGPFGGTETVDFESLGAGGLFLIHGPTGAGKTSVLDAVCFALYGKVPGAREAAKSLHSDHAGPSVKPEVTLETTIRGRRIRVVRSPKWERPKLRGSGTRVENASVLVQELPAGGDPTPISTRPGEADEFIGDLLGLNREQFCQLVLLPQGDFARFLRSGADERRKSLERIFDTGVFAKVEKWLAEHALGLKHAADAAEQEVSRVADLIADRSGSPRPIDTGLDDLTPWAAELACVARGTAFDAAEAAAELADHDRRAATALRAGRELAISRNRLAKARARSQELAGRADWRAGLRAQVEAADRAMPVVQLISGTDQARARLEKAHRRAIDALSFTDALLDLPDLVLTPDDPADVPAGDDALARGELRAAERLRRDEIARLTELHKSAVERDRVRRELDRLAARIEQLTTAHETTATELADLPDRRAPVLSALEQARSRTGAREALELRLSAARTVHDAVRESERLRAELGSAQEAHLSARESAVAAEERAVALDEARIAGMAAELADTLAAGSACPVCGSAEHPAPALGDEGRPTRDDQAAARRAATTARERREAAKSIVDALTERLAAAQAATQGCDASAAAEAVETAQAELTVSDAAEAEVVRLDERLVALDDALERARSEATRIGTERATAQAEVAELGRQEARLTERLDEARGDDADLAAREARLTTEADLLQFAAETLGDRLTAAEQVVEARRELRRGLAESGFDGVEAANHAARTAVQLRELRRQGEEYDHERVRVDTELDDPDLVAAGMAAPPDLAALADAAAEAERMREQAGAWRDRLDERARRLERLRADLTSRLADSLPARERHALAYGLSQLAAGTAKDNRDGVQLSSYVLAARLEQVAGAANDRLASMSGGRYLLRHTVDKAAGDRKRSGGGLGLRVLDSWTGQERDPATLSGGETFISSLALALGLGDVAGASAGAADINTLFVDEGFGTLDEDTLEEVLEVLDELRDGGRAVGVVSHVADLRNRIPTQLRVSKTASGSTIEQTS
ncbi:AAA family ATPase [Nocardiopsis ansamitocini]|uniref:Nuclease SbcCD subunit C n=1 Tax=Nocardiopsis ansamitocini TaxID=1670832 RepID=A0A9W6P2Q9_9ACTN|nr:SMC family ATPase [Nocardiopsis ansamitocini]GLU46169.1 nuclease SbcCD subunit C [Nocardiopsis ansamitocini]